MKKSLILITVLVCSFTLARGQYNKPYRITYNAAKKSFLICNRGNGTVTELDSAFKTKQVISGLSDPRDIQYARFGSNEGLVILDDNKLKIYDGSYSSVINFSIGVSNDAESMVFDLNSPGIFYISDKKGNRIIEGKVGPAPFYIPSFKVLTNSGIHRPSGLLIDNKGRLLVCEDSTNSAIVEINKSTGATKVLARTGIDSSNSIVQDKEGNFYLSNWSDSYVYRISPDLSSSRRLAGFSRPSGMLVQPDLDLLLICCTNCGKVDFQKLHWFEPASEAASCVGDSLIIQLSPLFNGIGTFGSGNRFYVDLSDSSGSFRSLTTLGFVQADTNPPSVPVMLPKGTYGSGHRYRLRSTSPAFTSSDERFIVYPSPIARAFTTDSTSICTGISIQLGSASQSGIRYAWSPGEKLSDSLTSQVRFSPDKAGAYTFEFLATDTLNGCMAKSAVYIEVADTISIPTWKQRLRACRGDSIRIGVSGTGYRFKWEPATYLSSDTTENPYWMANTNGRYLVSMLDPASGCSGRNYVDVMADSIPKLQLGERISVCAGKSVMIGDPRMDYPLISWTPASYLSDTTMSAPLFQSESPGTYEYFVRVVDGRQCEGRDTLRVDNLELPLLPIISDLEFRQKLHFKLSGGNVDSLEIFASASKTDSYRLLEKISVSDSVELDLGGDTMNNRWFSFRAMNEFGCETWSDSMMASINTGWVSENGLPGLKIYPNPVQGVLSVLSYGPQEDLKLEIADLNGRLIGTYSINADPYYVGTVDLKGLDSGIYMVRLVNGGGKAYSEYKRLLVLPH